MLTELISFREHWLHGAFSVFHPTSPTKLSLRGDSLESRGCKEGGLGVTQAGSVAHEVLCAQPEF